MGSIAINSAVSLTKDAHALEEIVFVKDEHAAVRPIIEHRGCKLFDDCGWFLPLRSLDTRVKRNSCERKCSSAGSMLDARESEHRLQPQRSMAQTYRLDGTRFFVRKVHQTRRRDLRILHGSRRVALGWMKSA